MQIFSISVRSKYIFIFFKDSKKVLKLHPNVYSNYFLYIGKELSNKEFIEIKNENDLESLVEWSKSYLTRYRVSSFMFKKKLTNKGISYKNRNYIINKMISLNLLNDVNFTSDLVWYCNSRNYGKYYIVNKLYTNGISPVIINKLQFDNNVEQEKMNHIAEKYLKNKQNINESIVLKLMNFLSRNGFDNEMVKDYINERFSEQTTNSLI